CLSTSSLTAVRRCTSPLSLHDALPILAHEAGIERQPPAMTEFMLSHCVGERSEVDVVLATAEQAGGQIVRPAHDTLLGGYSGMFKDPDGHLWEVAWSPPQPAAAPNPAAPPAPNPAP